MNRTFLMGVACVLLTGCSDEPLEGADNCENLSEEQCIMPFPSDYFRTEGDAGPAITFRDALPVATDGVRVADDAFESFDGWPTITPIQFRVPDATLDGVATFDDIGVSLDPGSKTLVIDTETGETMAHWVELDHFSETAGVPVMVVRLARALDYERRYVVVVRGLVDGAGALVPAPRGFAALRDGGEAPVVGVEDRRARFDAEVFPVAEKAGVARSEIQLAWDFTTGSEQSATGTLVAMRDRLLEIVGDEGPAYSIDEVEVYADNADIAFKVIGTVSVPSFMLPPNEDGIRLIRRDDDGVPVAEGTEDVTFELQFPHSALTGTEPAAVLQYGHGFLGGRDEANTGWLRKMANERNFIIAAMDMQGMNTAAGVTWFALLADSISPFSYLSEEPQQGVINHVALMRMLKGAFFAETDERFTNAGQPWYDNSRLYYYGNSQGGTTGSVIMALHVDVERGVLGVPGGAFSFLLNRAEQWTNVSTQLIQPQFTSTLDFVAISGVIQLGWDRFESYNFVRRAGDDPYPGSPQHQILIHVAKEDAQVNNFVSQCLARSADAKLITPAIRPVYGLEEVADAVTAPAVYVEYDFGAPDNSRPNAPAGKDTDTHEELRKSPLGQEQVWHFLTTGEVRHFCDGPCDPD